MKIMTCFLALVAILTSCQSPGKKNNNNPVPEVNSRADSNSMLIRANNGKSFKIIEEKLSASLSDILIIPQGFQYSKDTFKILDSQPLKRVMVEDLNNDGFQELYVVTTSSGSGSYAQLFGYASNNDLSVSPISIDEMQKSDLEKNGAYFGYMGHDSIYSDQHILHRRYPIYLDGDQNCCPTGGFKILKYNLVKGEASWQLVLAN